MVDLYLHSPGHCHPSASAWGLPCVLCGVLCVGVIEEYVHSVRVAKMTLIVTVTVTVTVTEYLF